MQYQSSGYLVVQSKAGGRYCGVDRSTGIVPDGVDWLEQEQYDLDECALGSREQAESYRDHCRNAGIETHLLYCRCTAPGTQVPAPPKEQLTFCGWDYAYPNGDYFSALCNEIIAGASALAERWQPRLNAYGLLSSEEDVAAFVRERADFAQTLGRDSMMLEKGFFAVFAVYML